MIHIVRHFSIATITLFLLGCAAAPPINTPTGRPEVTIASSNTAEIKSRLIAINETFGYTLMQDTPYSLVFQKAMEGLGGALYQAAMGNSYSSQPQLLARYTITPAGSSTRVFAAIGTSMQNVFGQSQGMDLSHGKAGGEIQSILEGLKTNIESGRGNRAQKKAPEASAHYPTAIPVSGKPGFVISPYAPEKGYVDVRGLAHGAKAHCPYTNNIFVVP